MALTSRRMRCLSPRPRARATYLLRSVDSHTLTTLMTSLTVLRKSCILAATRSAGEEHDGESRSELCTRAVSALRGVSPQPYSKEQLRSVCNGPNPRELHTAPRTTAPQMRIAESAASHTPS